MLSDGVFKHIQKFVSLARNMSQGNALFLEDLF
jgi:hypothetical protein